MLKYVQAYSNVLIFDAVFPTEGNCTQTLTDTYICKYIRHRASARERERLPPTSPTPFNLVQVWGSRSEVQGGGAPPLECVFLGGEGGLLASSCVSLRPFFYVLFYTVCGTHFFR